MNRRRVWCLPKHVCDQNKLGWHDLVVVTTSGGRKWTSAALLRCFVYIKQSFWALESPVMNSKSVQCTGPHLWHQKSCRQWVQAQIRRTNKDCYWYTQNRPTKLHANDWNGWNPVKQCTPSSHKCARTGSPGEPGVKQVSLRVSTKVRS